MHLSNCNVIDQNQPLCCCMSDTLLFNQSNWTVVLNYYNLKNLSQKSQQIKVRRRKCHDPQSLRT